MTTPRPVKVCTNDESGHQTCTDATFTIHPDLSATITIDGETRAYFPPRRYPHMSHTLPCDLLPGPVIE